MDDICNIDGVTKWLSTEDLARELGIPVSTIYGWRHEGIGPWGIRMGRHIRYKREDVDAWVARQEELTGKGDRT